MRNQEAARYARWAAAAAAAIALVVAGVYAKRSIEAARARRSQPAVVPATVQQQSAEFKFTKMEQDRAIFTIRASTATRYKDEDRSLLEDVWITIYGRAGDRNDNIHTRECSYEPKSGEVSCAGAVEIDIQGANPASGKPADKQLQVRTSNISFNRDTGEASSPEKVEFESPQGHGSAVGVSYNSQTAVVRLERDVAIEVIPPNGNDQRAAQHSQSTALVSAGVPITATGSSLEVRRNDRLVVLNGPALLTQGARQLSARQISIALDSNFHAQKVVADGSPVVTSNEPGTEMNVSAGRFEGLLSPAGWMQSLIADGNVRGSRTAKSGTDRFSAAKVEFAMLPERNLVREMKVSGNVNMDSQQGPASRSLKTEALLVKFGAAAQPDLQKIQSAETLAPATIETRLETRAGAETTKLRARKFETQFLPSGKLERLLGHGDVEVQRQIGKATPQLSSSAELAATFSPSGEWDTLDQSGNVRFQEADRRASAQEAKFDRASDLITLEGSPVVSDATSRTTAGSVTINQKSGEIRATGNVVSTYTAAGQSGATNLGSGPAHVSANLLTGSTSSGHVLYSGHARLWQGESVLDANQIEVWRDDKKLQATGNVVAVFPQGASSGLGAGFGPSAATHARDSSVAPAASPSAGKAPQSNSTLWVIHAPMLTYWDSQSKARLEGGVTATSAQGEMTSKSLDAYLGPAAATGKPESTGRPQGAAASVGRQLDRIVALGNVVVRQGDRRGSAQEAVYTAADQKFVLSGGEPTISDANSDTTTGHSLTFFVANDTILIDSEEGSRTLTKHRVEK